MKKLNKKSALILALSILAVIAVPVGVYAVLFAAPTEETNKFQGAYVDAAVVEKSSNHEDSDNNVEIYPALRNSGDNVEKIVTIKNIGTETNAASMYSRVKLIPSIVSDDTKNPSIIGGEIKITYEFEANTAWKMKDNTYYYTKAIDPGNESEILLKKVTINQDIPEGYHLELKVMADSIVTRPATILTDTWGVKTDFSDCTPLE